MYKSGPNSLSEADLRRRLLTALALAPERQMQRNDLREAIHPSLRVARFDMILGPLLAEGLVSGERVIMYHALFNGREVPHECTLYRLTRKGRIVTGRTIKPVGPVDSTLPRR